jgi:hypothetical protein
MKLLRIGLPVTIVLLPLACLMFVVGKRTTPPASPTISTQRVPGSSYDPGLAAAVAGSDRIVLVHAGYSARIGTGKALLEITEGSAVADFNANIQFSPTDPMWAGRCACPGYPRVEWYRDGECIAFAAFHHGTKLRWEGSGFDEQLTPASAAWIQALGKSLGIRMTGPAPFVPAASLR